jgi:hypothetical protein
VQWISVRNITGQTAFADKITNNNAKESLANIQGRFMNESADKQFCKIAFHCH